MKIKDVISILELAGGCALAIDAFIRMSPEIREICMKWYISGAKTLKIG